MDTIHQDLHLNVAEIELSFKSKIKSSARPVVNTSREAYNILIGIWNHEKIELLEEFKVLLLNRANKVMGCIHISSGGLTGTVADPRLILIAALKSAACSIILCHNHPSGNLKPSQADEQLTGKIKSACEFIDVTVLDHLIISKDGYFSFGDEGIL